MIITQADYPQVRAAISIEWDEKMLPDAIIAMDVYQGTAERWAKALDPAWETRTDCELQQLKLAVCLMTASLLIPALPHTVTESFAGEGGFTKATVDWEARARDLFNRASGIVGEITGGVVPPEQIISKSIPPFFTSVAPADTASRCGAMWWGEPAIIARVRR